MTRLTFAGTGNYTGAPEDEPCACCSAPYAQHYSRTGQSPAECSPVRPTRAVRDLLRVARAYASPDSWGVPAIYFGILHDLAADLAAGDDARAIAAHAKHVDGPTGKACTRAQCVARAPHHLEPDLQRERNKAALA